MAHTCLTKVTHMRGEWISKLAASALFLLVTGISTHAQTVLIAPGSDWRYLDNGSDQGTAWRTAGFSDAGWAEGPAELGYGDDTETPPRPEATVISFGADDQNKHATYYFRRTFNVTDASSITNLRVGLVRDDGGIVYLNGTEVFRSNMPAGEVLYTDFASSTVGGADEVDFFAGSINASLLVNGANLLAVEVHQGSGTSSDVSFDLELIGNPQPEISVVSPTNGQVLTLVNVPITVSATPGGESIERIQFFGNSVLLGEVTAPPYNFVWQGLTPGTYTVYARIEDSSGLTADSDPVTFTVQELPASTLVPRGSIWRYEDSNTDLGTAWRNPGYNDGAWGSGPGPLGNGALGGEESHIATPVNIGPAGARIPTVYYRHTFTVNDPSAYVGLVLNLLRDDGAAVYLNGQEIVRDGVAVGAVHATFASQTVGVPDETAYFQSVASASALVAGVNVLAGESKNVSTGSSDLGFDFEVIGDLVPVVNLTSPLPGEIFQAPALITISADAVDEGGSVASVQFFDGPNLIGQRTAPPYSMVWSNVVDGAHTLTASVTDNTGNTATSTPVNITVVDPNPPTLVSAAASTNEVTVVFSKRMSNLTTTNIANYAISGVEGSATVLEATLVAPGNQVVLRTTEMVSGADYTLTVNNVESLDEQVIAPNSQITFTIQQFVLTTIGAPAFAGMQVPVAGGFDVTGAGTNILGNNDQFTFSFVERLDDFDLKVRVSSFDMAVSWARAGLIARESMSTSARFASSMASPNVAGSFFQARASAGGQSTQQGFFPVNYPYTWLRLQRQTDTFTGYASVDGETWEILGSVALPAAVRPMLVGLAVSSGSSSSPAMAGFRDFSDATGDPVGGILFDREPLGPSTRRGPLVISEIMYNPKNQPGIMGSTEFIEIYNSQAWAEDISGYRISGAVDYTFPDGTTIGSGQFLVVARNPGALTAASGVGGILGPWELNEDGSENGLPNDSGLLRIRGHIGQVLFEVEYEDRAPWPEAADGSGHSLVLARPSFGEADPRAWQASDRIGGSPGRYDALSPDPLRPVVINEFLAHTDLPQVDFIELYNHSDQAVDLNGAWLSDDPDTNKFRIGSVVVAPRGHHSFSQVELGFNLSSGGERIFLVNSNQTRVIDAFRFEGQANGIATGRYPDGAAEFYELSSVTAGGLNAAPLIRDIVINEIMYNPITGNDNDEYVELYNKGTVPVNVGGWRFTAGIDYMLPAGTIIQPDGYLVVARSVTNLLARHPQLNAANTVGDFNGGLANGGEYLALSMPDEVVDIETNQLGMPISVTNIIYIVVDDLTYDDGGRWGWWSDGGGSSLELKDPRSDNRQPANWADSDETQKATWTSIEKTAPLGEILGTANDFLYILQLGVGEFILDDVEVVNFGGGNSVPNPGFESGLSGWIPQASHSQSTLTSDAFSGASALHVRAGSRGDDGANNLQTANLAPAAAGTTQAPLTVRCKARWVRGWPEILLRLHGGGFEVGAPLELPPNLGSPGLPNSQLVSNTGPAIWDVQHAPVLPRAGAPVIVTARVLDPDGVAALRVRYRNDTSSGATQTLAMNDNGTSGDSVAGDGVFAATLPAQGAGTVIAFHLEAVDNLGTTNLFPQDVFPRPGMNRVFPTDALTRELLVRWGEQIIPGAFGNYRVWLTRANRDQWANRRPVLDNTVMDGTFVYNNYRVIYNLKPQYAGSPWHQGQMDTGPDGGDRVDFDIEFPTDDRFLGVTDAVWNYPGNPEGGNSTDGSAQSEQTSYVMYKGIGLFHNHRRYAHIFVNGSHRSTISSISGNFIMEDSQQPNGNAIEQWSSDDPDGQLYKIEDWFSFVRNASSFGNNDADLERRTVTMPDGSQPLTVSPYRFMWRLRSVESGQSANDYTNLINLINIVSPPSAPTATTIQNLDAFLGAADGEQWMRMFSVRHAVGDWDGYGYRRGKNAYMYVDSDGRNAQQWTWDIDFTMGVGGDGAGQNLFQTTDPRVSAMYATPHLRRAYFRGWQDLVDGPWNNAVVDAYLDAKHAALLANGVNANSGTLTTIKNFINAQRNALLTQLANNDDPFAVDGSTSLTLSNNLVILTGTAPIKLKDMLVNGVVTPVTWTTMTQWRMVLLANPGLNTYVLSGLDSYGNPVPGVSEIVTADFTGSPVDPAGAIVFNEIMYQPQTPDASFVELFNTSDTVSFDMSGWRINGLDLSFPQGTIISNRQHMILAKNPGAFSFAYSSGIPVTAVFDGNIDPDGETLTLFKPGATPEEDEVIDKIRYEPGLPWPPTANGTGPSLQLIDPDEDNSRASNWSDGVGWRTFTFTGPAGPLANRYLFALANAGEIYIDDIQLVPGTEPGVGPNVLVNGDFETGALAPWTVLRNHSNSVVTANVAYEGSYSLHVIATGQGSTGDYIGQTFAALPSDQVYTLSFQYLPVGSNRLKWRLSNQFLDFLIGIDVTPIYSTPGQFNTSDRDLPTYDAVWLNEVAPGNSSGLTDSAGDTDPWIELYNAGTTTVSLQGYYLANNYESNLTQWAFPAGSSIAPGEFKVVWVDGEPGETVGAELHTSWRLTAGTGTVSLNRIVSGPQITDYLTYAGLATDESYGDFPDGQPFNRLVFSVKSPGGMNIGNPVELYINEWMAANTDTVQDPADGSFADWFEIYNPGAEPVDLSGYTLTDNLADKNQYVIPAGFSISAGGFLIVWADNDPEQSNPLTGSLHSNFALGRNGEALGLYTPQGVAVDEITFGVQNDDVSEGRFPDGDVARAFMTTPTPGAPNVFGGGNTAPTLDPIANRTLYLGQTLSVVLSASDAEVPPQSLTFGLLAGAPAGMGVISTSATTGMLTWTPNEAQAPGTNMVTVTVADNGAPPMGDQQAFTVTVLLPPTIGIGVSGGQVSLSFPTIQGKSYQVQFADVLGDPVVWTNLGAPVVATGTTLTIMDPVGANSQRFYQVIELP